MSSDGVANAATVFVEGEVASIVKAVFDLPVPADELAESCIIGFGWQQAGNTVGYLFAARTVRIDNFSLNGKDPGGVREAHLFGFNSPTDNAATFDPSMVLIMMPFLPGKKAIAATFPEQS